MTDEDKADKMIFECVVALFYWLTSDRCSHADAREIIHYNVDRMIDRVEAK